MVSHDLLRSTVTDKITFDQRDSKIERAMDRSEGRHRTGHKNLVITLPMEVRFRTPSTHEEFP